MKDWIHFFSSNWFNWFNWFIALDLHCNSTYNNWQLVHFTYYLYFVQDGNCQSSIKVNSSHTLSLRKLMRRPLYEQVRLYNLVPKARVLLDQRSGNAGRYVVYGEADIGACAEDCFAYFPSLSLPMTKFFSFSNFH